MDMEDAGDKITENNLEIKTYNVDINKRELASGK